MDAVRRAVDRSSLWNVHGDVHKKETCWAIDGTIDSIWSTVDCMVDRLALLDLTKIVELDVEQILCI